MVAAMTMPVLIANKQRKELQTGLKEAYSVLQQALTRASYEQGETVTSQNAANRKLKSIIMPYFDSPVDCSWGGVHGTNASTVICAGGTTENSVQSIDIYNNYSKKSGKIKANPLDDGQFVIKNGMLIMIENIENTYISVDVNGNGKKPNAWGHDLFTFQLMDDGKLLPMGAPGTVYYNQECSKTSTSLTNGIGCTYKAFTDQNYWKTLP